MEQVVKLYLFNLVALWGRTSLADVELLLRGHFFAEIAKAKLLELLFVDGKATTSFLLGDHSEMGAFGSAVTANWASQNSTYLQLRPHIRLKKYLFAAETLSHSGQKENDFSEKIDLLDK